MKLSWDLVREAGGEDFDEHVFLLGRVSTRLHPLLIEEAHALSDPASRVAAVRDDTQHTPTEILQVEVSNVLEGDEAVLKTPVSCSPPTSTNVVEVNYFKDKVYFIKYDTQYLQLIMQA